MSRELKPLPSVFSLVVNDGGYQHCARCAGLIGSGDRCFVAWRLPGQWGTYLHTERCPARKDRGGQYCGWSDIERAEWAAIRPYGEDELEPARQRQWQDELDYFAAMERRRKEKHWDRSWQVYVALNAALWVIGIREEPCPFAELLGRRYPPSLCVFVTYPPGYVAAELALLVPPQNKNVLWPTATWQEPVPYLAPRQSADDHEEIGDGEICADADRAIRKTRGTYGSDSPPASNSPNFPKSVVLWRNHEEDRWISDCDVLTGHRQRLTALSEKAWEWHRLTRHWLESVTFKGDPTALGAWQPRATLWAMPSQETMRESLRPLRKKRRRPYRAKPHMVLAHDLANDRAVVCSMQCEARVRVPRLQFDIELRPRPKDRLIGTKVATIDGREYQVAVFAPRTHREETDPNGKATLAEHYGVKSQDDEFGWYLRAEYLQAIAEAAKRKGHDLWRCPHGVWDPCKRGITCPDCSRETALQLWGGGRRERGDGTPIDLPAPLQGEFGKSIRELVAEYGEETRRKRKEKRKFVPQSYRGDSTNNIPPPVQNLDDLLID